MLTSNSSEPRRGDGTPARLVDSVAPLTLGSAFFRHSSPNTTVHECPSPLAGRLGAASRKRILEADIGERILVSVVVSERSGYWFQLSFRSEKTTETNTPPVVAGLGSHTIQLGNGCNILIDGPASVTPTPAFPNDSFRSILLAWKGGTPASMLRSRFAVTFNTVNKPSALFAGSGNDWFFFTNPKTTANKKANDTLN
jgi:hypothetical protein